MVAAFCSVDGATPTHGSGQSPAPTDVWCPPPRRSLLPQLPPRSLGIPPAYLGAVKGAGWPLEGTTITNGRSQLASWHQRVSAIPAGGTR